MRQELKSGIEAEVTRWRHGFNREDGGEAFEALFLRLAES
jgi:hypothetical protein